MEIVWFVISGIAGGVFGGMGMGGGTLLIPLLTLLLSVSQISAQGFNLISFLPMSIIAIIIHFKNKLIYFNKIWIVILPAIIFSVVGSFVANKINSNLLKILFGVFLNCIAVVEIIKIFLNKE